MNSNVSDRRHARVLGDRSGHFQARDLDVGPGPLDTHGKVPLYPVLLMEEQLAAPRADALEQGLPDVLLPLDVQRPALCRDDQKPILELEVSPVQLDIQRGEARRIFGHVRV